MKLEVFEYLIAIEKFGSLNKAATNLYVSQPNLSNVIKSFENEVGYKIIYRNHQGVQFTNKGKQVLMIAHNMVKEKEKLMKINLNHQKVSLKISIGNGNYALKPIYHILNQQSFQDEINITILNLAVWDALESLYQQTIDLAYLIIPAFMKKEMIAYCQNHHLLFNQLKELTCQINLRQNHPLLDHFSKEGLWNYPFVDFINNQPYVYGDYQQYINPHKIIYVDHHSLRRKIIQETDAFSIGIPSLDNRLDSFISIPTPELKMIICEVRHLEDKKNLLFDEFHQIIENDIQNYF